MWRHAALVVFLHQPALVEILVLPQEWTFRESQIVMGIRIGRRRRSPLTVVLVVSVVEIHTDASDVMVDAELIELRPGVERTPGPGQRLPAPVEAAIELVTHYLKSSVRSGALLAEDRSDPVEVRVG